MSIKTFQIENDLYDISDTNIVQKISPHFNEIIKDLKYAGIKHAKIITKIKELSSKQAAVYTEIIEETWPIDIEEIKKDEME